MTRTLRASAAKAAMTLAALLALAAPVALAAAPPAAAAPAVDGLVVHYALDETSGTTLIDSSGNGRDGTLNGGAAFVRGEGLTFGGTNGYATLPDNLMRGLDQITVALDVRIDADQQTPYFIYGLGNSSSGVGNGYLFTSGNAYRTSIATGNWSTEQTTGTSTNLDRGVWRHLAYTLSGGTAVLYQDGVEVARKTGVTIKPGDIGGGTTTANYLGRSLYSADKYFKGSMRDFRIYDHALSAQEVYALGYVSDLERVQTDAAALDLGDTSAVTADLSLPTKGANDTTITWTSSDPALVSTTGQVTRPAPKTSDAPVTLTATVSKGTESATREFAVTVLEDDSDVVKVAQAAEALTLPDVSDVRGNLTLPATGLHGATITWRSTNPSVITATGEVTRPAYGSKAQRLELLATLTVGSKSRTKAFHAVVPPLPKPAEPMKGYMFAYFTGEGYSNGEQIYFAASRGNDPLHWDELNGGQPVLTSSLGEKGVRDPFIIRSPEGDKFYLIATDLKIYGGNGWDAAQRTGSKSLMVWESTDLVNWSDQRMVQVSPDTAGNTWAPEAFYDETIGAYVVFWASKLYDESDTAHSGNTYNRMMYATTRDFRTFTPAKVWVDPGYSVIDSTVIKEGDTFYRFTKDERNNTSSTPCSKFIVQEKSTTLRNLNWDFVAECIGKATETSPGIAQGEGPTIFKSNTEQKWYLFIDENGGRGYVPFEATDLASGKWTMSTNYQLPSRPRHGTVMPVTQAELDRLKAPPAPPKADKEGLVAHYALDQTGGTIAVDSSGHGYDGTLSGDVTLADGQATFGGTNGHVKLPDNIMAGMDAITVSAQVWIDPAQPTPYWIWGLGNSTSGVGNGYLFTTGDGYRTSITQTDWRGEQSVAGPPVGRGAWHTLTYTLDGSTAVLYADGVEVSRKTDITVRPGSIGNGVTTANYLGRSLYSADRYFKGKMRDVRIYNRALASDEVGTLPGNTTYVHSVALPELKTKAIIDGNTSTITLPVKPGTDLTRLAPEFGLALKARISPKNGRTMDLSQPVTYTVTGQDKATREWTVKALEMGSPVLPGFNADPNITVFGDTYYIYPTTDGIDNWGSTTFSAWSSKDLVTWTNHGVILDLGPDVSWADGRAWAPTMTEKDGKFYFYFCADTNIGVAVGNSPTGPFTDSGAPLVPAGSRSGQMIDPAVFTDTDGTTYLYWGNGSAYVVPLNADLVSFDATKVRTITGLTGFREGLFMNKRGDTYYLSWSIDDTRSENYRVGYATGSSPYGPFTNRGEILSKDLSLGIKGTGHSSIIQIPGTDEWYIAYHRFAIPDGDGTHREVTIDRLWFEPDGSIRKVVPTLSSVAPRPLT
jgi:beta-xylosidase